MNHLQEVPTRCPECFSRKCSSFTRCRRCIAWICWQCRTAFTVYRTPTWVYMYQKGHMTDCPRRKSKVDE